MRCIVIIILFVFVSGKVKSQDAYDCNCYDRLVNLSSYYKIQGNSKEALKVYKRGLNFKEKAKWTPY